MWHFYQPLALSLKHLMWFSALFERNLSGTSQELLSTLNVHYMQAMTHAVTGVNVECEHPQPFPDRYLNVWSYMVIQ